MRDSLPVGNWLAAQAVDLTTGATRAVPIASLELLREPIEPVAMTLDGRHLAFWSDGPDATTHALVLMDLQTDTTRILATAPVQAIPPAWPVLHALRALWVE
jgi:hypothetical protein